MDPINSVIVKKRGRKPKNTIITENVVKQEPKKRGRKPKPKSDDENIIKIPKKRGRKPKPKTSIDNITKIPKKRGRKPKEKVYSVLHENNNNLYELDNNIILHLPIKSSDVEDSEKMGSLDLLKYDPEQKEPDPYDPVGISTYSTVNNDIADDIADDNNYDNKNDIMDDTTNEITSNNDYYPEDQYVNDKLLRNKVNILDTNYDFYDANKNKTWPVKTNLYCLWCCHPFDTPPVPLPLKLVRNKFFVDGCFCSFNCSAAYNFDKSYPDKWERYSLLHLLYKKIYETSFRKILLAPPKEVLKVFGGHMSITEYRKNLITNEKSFKIISPPIISIIPKIEENITMRIVQNNKFIPINQNLMDKASLSLRLKRDKPITESNKTLYSYMDLTVS